MKTHNKQRLCSVSTPQCKCAIFIPCYHGLCPAFPEFAYRYTCASLNIHVKTIRIFLITSTVFIHHKQNKLLIQTRHRDVLFMMQSPFDFIYVLRVIAYLHHHGSLSPSNTYSTAHPFSATWDFTISKSVIKHYYTIWVCLRKHFVFNFRQTRSTNGWDVFIHHAFITWCLSFSKTLRQLTSQQSSNLSWVHT